jgi:hypothetical protein
MSSISNEDWFNLARVKSAEVDCLLEECKLRQGEIDRLTQQHVLGCEPMIATLRARVFYLEAVLQTLQGAVVNASTVEGALPWTSDMVAALQAVNAALTTMNVMRGDNGS